MPGLSFLAKKSWHTSNLKNVEKVWIAEQKQEQEQKKLSELQKQLEEERQIQELRQLQAASGQNVKHLDTSMDWMYEGPAAAANAAKQQQSEEYLLGKIYKPQETKTFDLNIPVVQGQQDSSWMAKVSTKNDTFTRMHEDPFIMIKQEEKKKRDAVISNPVKMERIRATLSKEMESYEQDKEQRRRARRELKDREKKEKKDRKKEKKDKKRAEEKEGRSARDRSRSRSSSESEGSRSPAGNRKRARSPSPPSRRHNDNRDSRDRDTRRDTNRDRDSRDRKHARDSRDRPDASSSSRDHDSRYGLQSRNGASQVTDRDYLGPRPDLLKKKDDERAATIATKLSAAQRTRMSDEERMARLAAMERDAAVIDHTKASNLAVIAAKHRENDAEHTGKARFLADMRTEVYRQTADSDIKTRLDQRKHNRQSGVEQDEDDGFLKRGR